MFVSERGSPERYLYSSEVCCPMKLKVLKQTKFFHKLFNILLNLLIYITLL